jgi:hypothetical protein
VVGAWLVDGSVAVVAAMLDPDSVLESETDESETDEAVAELADEAAVDDEIDGQEGAVDGELVEGTGLVEEAGLVEAAVLVDGSELWVDGGGNLGGRLVSGGRTLVTSVITGSGLSGAPMPWSR